MAQQRQRHLRGDLRALVQRQLLSEADCAAWEQQLDCGDDEARQHVLQRVRALFQRELDELIRRIREQHNERQHATLMDSDLVAMATGGALGALNAWMRRPAPAPVASVFTKQTPSLWVSALDAAQASLNVMRQRRLVEHMQIQHLCGDEADAEHVLLCINGFMTQSADPLRNWGAWSVDQPNVVAYAVLWEAGDVDVWNEFCAHVNDKLSSATGSASALLAHFSGNPWHKAQDKAHHVGALLAHVLASQPTFTRGRRVTLMGHSLGGAVIYSALQELERLRNDQHPTLPPLVTNVVFCAAAFVPEASELRAAAAQVADNGKIVNVFSRRDGVLSQLFWVTNLHAKDDGMAAGCIAIDFANAGLSTSKAVNVEVSDVVVPSMSTQFGHSYGPSMATIMARVAPHLPAVYAKTDDISSGTSTSSNAQSA
ncbi:TPA: hypothetical protein N0F65_011813 [Lagenidium giganteum]|uniref:Fungal lipase-like domain-containing protein n=1 Tax=Lagenidium giganteum TaxID=4803 RepID=A0AAV2YTM5_9STRA|nr:TPA: hypothetical protein N0F65_011813 [Lagenidium giganteum]